MKNPFALVKNAVMNFLQSPVKIVLTLVVLFDQLVQAKKNPNCQEVVFTPTASGKSYTLEIVSTNCELLKTLAQSGSTAFCVKGLYNYEFVAISSLSDIERTNPKTGTPIKDVLGFAHSHTSTGAIIAESNKLPVKVFASTSNPRCSTMSFFNKESEGLPKIKDISPVELRNALNRFKSYQNEGEQHCIDNEYIRGRLCHSEL